MRSIIPLYGSFSINTYGFFIVLGIIITSWLILADARRSALLSIDQYYAVLSRAIVGGFIGGRLLFTISNWQQLPTIWHFFAFWEGGFSVLGGVMLLMGVIPWYLRSHKIPVLATLDLLCTYIPLLQGISRIGCFFAGCCYGIAWNSSCLHPTQLYSVGAFWLIFIFLYCAHKRLQKIPGQIFCWYLLLMGTERFVIDFWRGDREFVSAVPALSLAQLIALGMSSIGLTGLLYLLNKRRNR